jgi:protein involved in polysaccharide export with SLBB domain
VVEIQRQMRVIDAIAEMGGFSPFARKDEIRILRNSQNRQIEYLFDYEAFVKGRSPDSNILLEPGDTIIVTE